MFKRVEFLFAVGIKAPEQIILCSGACYVGKEYSFAFGNPNRTPAPAVAVWKGAAAEWVNGDFCKKVAANDMPSAATWEALTKKIPAENETSGFRRDSSSFL